MAMNLLRCGVGVKLATNSFINQSKLLTSLIPQIEFTRDLHRKRTSRRREWLPRRTTGIRNTDVTDENKEFLKEVVADRFQGGYNHENSPLIDEPWERHQWTPKTKRTGVIAVKIGIIPQWTKSGRKFYCTLLQVIDNHVIKYTAPEDVPPTPYYKKQFWYGKRGVVEVGALSTSPHLFTKSYYQKFLEAGVAPKRQVTRYAVTPDAAIKPGTPLTVNHFQVGDYVDVQAKTVGHGFQGVMKRWGMKGGPASHGSTKFHRKMGSTGGGGDKSGIWKGKKMPGHMGMSWCVLRGLKIWKIDTKHNVLYVNGYRAPGPNHCYMRVYDTRLLYRIDELNARNRPPPMPSYFPEDSSEPLPEEIYDEELFQMSDDTLIFDEEAEA
ncbi:large ribosomal subunit protein uL3m-like [Tubulanus polymorphus]|uniref:large ribosomal subunit protein uL3m-like n=1 Tax=Tubulanus polymorphus TaxID=672921 RepID=UPI003DA2F163